MKSGQSEQNRIQNRRHNRKNYFYKPGKEEYKNYLDLIRQGYMLFEENARQMAFKYGFSLDDLEAALAEGYKRKYDTYLILISKGNPQYEGLARKIAQENGFSTNELEELLKQRREFIADK